MLAPLGQEHPEMAAEWVTAGGAYEPTQPVKATADINLLSVQVERITSP